MKGKIAIVGGGRHSLLTATQINEAYQQGRADAIEECYMKAKTMMDDIRYHSSNKRVGKAHAMYCVQALEFLRQVAEQLKEQNND